MSRAFRNIAFWAALIVSASLLVIGAAATAWAVYTRIGLPAKDARLGSLAITYGIILVLFAAIFSGVLFGWGRERCEARELRRQAAALRRDIRELEEKMAAEPARREPCRPYLGRGTAVDDRTDAARQTARQD